MKRLIVVIVLLATWLSLLPPLTTSAAGDIEAEYVADELIVGVDRSAGIEVRALAAEVGATVVDVSIGGDAYLLRVRNPGALPRSLGILRTARGVRYVERNGIMRIPPVPEPQRRPGSPIIQSYTPNDSLGEGQWHLDKILYRLTDPPAGTPPCIVVFDTGVDYNHPDLAGKVYRGRDTFDGDNDPMDAHGHGTHVAGIAAAKTNNTVGISGVSPNSNILAVRVLGPDGWGTFWSIGKGIQWANSRTAAACGGQVPRVYNLSLGAPVNSSFVSNAIATAASQGRLVVAAAGNDETSTKFYPGADPNAFGVAATEENDRRTYFSNFDTAGDPWVDIAAPGWQILSTVPSGYIHYSGTSMASPVVAGVAARVWAENPGFSAGEVRNQIVNTADPTQGFPRMIRRVNLYRALGGTGGFLQGRVLDAHEGIPLSNVSVTVSGPGGYSCSAATNAGGFYTCTGIPSAENYTVSASAAGRPGVSREFSVGGSLRRFNADLAMSRDFGTSGDWTITLLWRGFQPWGNPGREFDLWLRDPINDVCYSAWSNPRDQDNWRILLPRDSFGVTQTEGALIRKTYGGVLQVWVALFDEVLGWWPASARLTGSGLEVRIYKNNTLVKAFVAPASVSSPLPLRDQDNWYVGQIDLDNES